MNQKNYLIKTKNYQLKLLEENDLDFFLSLYQDKKLMSFVGSFNKDKLLNSFKISVSFNHSISFKRLTFSIYHGNSQVGITSLIRSGKNQSECEIGTIIKTDSLNKGIACEIMRKLIKFAFSQLRMQRVFARFSTKNKSAFRLVKKLNFIIIEAENGFYYCHINSR